MDSKEAGFHELSVSLDRTKFIWMIWHPQSHHPSESEAWYMRKKVLGLHGASNIIGWSLVIKPLCDEVLSTKSILKGVWESGQPATATTPIYVKRRRRNRRTPLKTIGEETPTYPEDGSLETVCVDLWSVDNAGRAGGAETVSRSGKGMEQSLWGRNDSQTVFPEQKLRATAGCEMLFAQTECAWGRTGKADFSVPPTSSPGHDMETSYSL